jgi:hypothetical protein
MKRQKAVKAIKQRIEQRSFTVMTEQTKTVWLIRIDRGRVSRTGGLIADIGVVIAMIGSWLDAWAQGDAEAQGMGLILFPCFICGYDFSASNSAPRTFAFSNNDGCVAALCWRCARQSDATLLVKASEEMFDHTFECRPPGFYHSPSSSVN